MKNNYDKLQQDQIKKEVLPKGEKPTLLLHACCAPCSTACLERLVQYFNITVYFYNPNITFEEEYLKRLTELENFLTVAYKGEVKLIAENFNPQEFYTAVSGRENDVEGGNRCKICYALRLDKTAKTAKEKGFNYFTSTLSVSPHKNSAWLNEIGESVGKKYEITYLYADFKKQGGYLRSIELSKEYNLYRQNYCGCEFSKNK